MDSQKLNSSRVREILHDCSVIHLYFASGKELTMNYKNFVSDFNEYDLWDGIECISLVYYKDTGFIGGVYLA